MSAYSLIEINSMKLILNILIMATLLVAANTLAQTSTPYGVFNPLALLQTSAHNQAHPANSAFYNYGNKGYGFVVEAVNTPTPEQPQLASLNR